MLEMSEEERYRERLFDTMQDAGLVDNLKVRIRQKLIEKLQHERKVKEVEPDKLFVKKVCSSLIADYLRASSLDYSLSVFVPESGFGQSLLLTQELSSLLKISGKQHSLLETLVGEALPKRARTQFFTDAEQQTDDSSTVESLELKLRLIEDDYKGKAAQNALLKIAEERQERELQWKKQLNKKQAEYNELKRLRENEIMNIKQEERDRYNLQFRQAKQQFELKYKQKLTKLREREEEVLKRVTDKMSEMQSFNHSSRQKILKDMELLRLKERELQRMRQALDERERQLDKR